MKNPTQTQSNCTSTSPAVTMQYSRQHYYYSCAFQRRHHDQLSRHHLDFSCHNCGDDDETVHTNLLITTPEVNKNNYYNEEKSATWRMFSLDSKKQPTLEEHEDAISLASTSSISLENDDDSLLEIDSSDDETDNDDDNNNNNDDDVEAQKNPKATIASSPRHVRFADGLVTCVRYYEKPNHKDQERIHYSAHDYCRMKADYIWEIQHVQIEHLIAELSFM